MNPSNCSNYVHRKRQKQNLLIKLISYRCMKSGQLLADCVLSARGVGCMGLVVQRFWVRSSGFGDAEFKGYKRLILYIILIKIWNTDIP